MTTPTAKEVARELDRRHRRRRLIILGGWAVLVVLAALYLRCGRGWGLSGGSGGTGGGAGSAAQPEKPKRCDVRVTSNGYELAGHLATADDIISKCEQGVDVIITGAAPQGDWDSLRKRLDAAHISTFVH